MTLTIRGTAWALLVGLAATLSCGREITGPVASAPAAEGFAFAVKFPRMAAATAADLVPFDRVRVVLRPAQGNTVSVDTVVSFPSGAMEVSVSLDVPLERGTPDAGALLDLSLAFVNAAGDTVFRAGPEPVQVVPTGSSVPQPPPPVLEPEYVGTGANATQVVIAPDTIYVLAGDGFSFSAEARDASQQPIVGTPIGWMSLNPSVATIPNAGAGAGTAQVARGAARIVAQLATGQADTAIVMVAPKLQGLVKVSGDAQEADTGTVLPQAIVVRVNATDALPLAGIPVVFAAQNGGEVSADTVTSDASGLAQTNWTLGAAEGAQSLTATVAGQPTMTVTFTATATITEPPPPNANWNEWTNASGGSWSVAGNWSQGRVPNATDTVVIAAAGTYTVTLGASFSGHYLVVGGGAGTPTLAVTGTTTLNLDEALRVETGGTLRILGTSSPGNANVTITNGFTNNGAIELVSEVSGYTAALTVTNGTLVNASGGTITSAPGTGGSRTLAAQLANQGTLTINTALTLAKASAAHASSGIIDVTGGNLTVTQTGTSPTFTNTGTIALAASHALTVAGGTLDLSNGVVSGSGTLVTTGTVVTTFSTATVRTPVTFSTGTTVPLAFTLPPGDSLRLAGGTFAPTSLTNNGTLIAEGAATITTATFDNPGTLLVRGSGVHGNAVTTVTNPFTNVGTIRLSSMVSGYSATFAAPTGPLVNDSTGTIVVDAGTGGARTLAVELDNRGTVTLNTATTLSQPSAEHVNSGVINVLGGNFTVTQSGTTPGFTNAGTIAVADSRTWTVGGGTLDLTPGIVTGYDGFVVTTGTATVLFEVPDVQPRVTFSAATTVPSAFTVPAGDSLRLLGGTFAPTTLTNDGTLIVEASAAITTPTFDNPGTLLARGSALGGNAIATVTNPFSNAGTIRLNSIISGYTSTFAVPSGTFVNDTIGTVVIDVGTGGARTLAVQLDNRGTITLNAAMTLSQASAAHVNSGTINVTGGNLTVTQSGTEPSFANAGTIAVAAARTMTVGGGTLDLTQGLVSGFDGFVVTTGTATVLFEVPDVQPRVTFSAATTVPSAFTVPAGDSLRLLGGTFAPMSLLNNGTLLVEGAAAVTTPTFDNPGTLFSRGSALGGNAVTTVTNAFTNVGTIRLSSIVSGYTSTFAVPSGTFVNDTIGTIAIDVGTGGARTLALQLDNRGTVTLNAAATLSQASAAHVNSGTINVSGGNFTVAQSGTSPSFTNGGAIDVAASRTMTVSGGTLDLTPGVVSGYDGFVVTTGTVTVLFEVPDVQPRITFSAATTVPTAFTVPAGDSLRMLAGTFAPNGLVNNGTLIAEGSATITTPTFANPGTLLVRGSALGGNAIATVTNPFTNAGTIRLSSIVSGYTSTLTLPAGTLVNGLTGLIAIDVGTGGARTLAVELDNRGMLLLNTSLTLGRAGAAQVNNGSIDVLGGNLTVNQTGTSPTFTNADYIELAPSRTMTVSGGTLDLTGGLVAGYDGTLATTGPTTVLFEVPDVQPRLTFSTATVVPTTFTVPAGDSLRLHGGTFAPNGLVNNGTLIVEGTATITTPTFSNPGTLFARGSALGGNAVATVTNAFTNVGTIRLSSIVSGYTSTLSVPSGSLVNGANGVVAIDVGTGGSRTLAAQLDNQGTVNLNTALTLNRASAAHVNSGTINVIGGDFTVTQTGTTPSFTNSGLLALSAARTMSVGGGDLNLLAGQLTGYQATLSLSGTGTAQFNPATMQAYLNGGVGMAIPALTIASGDSLRLLGGTFVPASLTNNGTLVAYGSVTITTPTFSNPGLLRVLGSAVGGNAVTSFTNSFSNTGTIELTSVVSGYTATMNVTSGIANATTGKVFALQGTGGTRGIGGPVQQNGELTVSANVTLGISGMLTLNAGSVTTVNGTLTTPAGCTNNGGAITGRTCP